MTKQKAIKDSIAHWERMIKWAEKQDFDDISIMDYALGETTGIADCPLCSKYKTDYINSCYICPLYKKFGVCSENSKTNFYVSAISLDRKDWIIKAKKFLKQLESLLEKGGTNGKSKNHKSR